MPDKLTPNRSTFLRFVANDIYLGAKFELVAFFIKGHFTT